MYKGLFGMPYLGASALISLFFKPYHTLYVKNDSTRSFKYKELFFNTRKVKKNDSSPL
jgi:hypothetical protein